MNAFLTFIKWNSRARATDFNFILFYCVGLKTWYFSPYAHWDWVTISPGLFSSSYTSHKTLHSTAKHKKVRKIHDQRKFRLKLTVTLISSYSYSFFFIINPTILRVCKKNYLSKADKALNLPNGRSAIVIDIYLTFKLSFVS